MNIIVPSPEYLSFLKKKKSSKIKNKVYFILKSLCLLDTDPVVIHQTENAQFYQKKYVKIFHNDAAAQV